MPEYEYECPACGLTIEMEVPYGSVICHGCRAYMQRVYSAPAVLWQGGKPSAEGEHE